MIFRFCSEIASLMFQTFQYIWGFQKNGPDHRKQYTRFGGGFLLRTDIMKDLAVMDHFLCKDTIIKYIEKVWMWNGMVLRKRDTLHKSVNPILLWYPILFCYVGFNFSVSHFMCSVCFIVLRNILNSNWLISYILKLSERLRHFTADGSIHCI